MNFETENIEFKSGFTEEIYKEVIAFANTDGGIVYVGIDKDFKPNGVYVRQGTSSVPASAEQIRQMIKESDGDTFEDLRSLEQNLTFNAAERAFKMYGVDFGREKFLSLGMVQSKTDIYTNLALILSDQCKHTTKIAVFSDDACTVFRDSKEFCGSVFTQLEDAVNYLALCNKTSAEINGIVRTEKRDYPPEAVREALLNALIHRDYGFSGSIIINVTDNKMEFISLGGLLPGLSPDDIRSGISQPRNKNLAEVFHRLRLIESYGTGIRRIYNLYSGCAAQPQIEVTSNTFKIVLPNMNAIEEAATKIAASPQMREILDFIRENGQITETEIGELLGLKKTRAFTVAKQMRDLGLIKVVGRGESKKYILN